MQTLYEFPLNEKVRTYLRVEQLLSRLEACRQLDNAVQLNGFFDALFCLLELFERNDIRIELVKDMERHEQQLVKWSQHPDINNTALQQTLQQVVQLAKKLQTSNRLGGDLKQHKMLTAIRSRYAMLGSNCSFDLPQLHYWFNQPQQQKAEDVDSWLQELALTQEALRFNLAMLREKTPFSETQAEKGVISQSSENIDLVRIVSSADNGFYPTLSGNKYRFTIRFISFDGHSSAQDIDCKVAYC